MDFLLIMSEFLKSLEANIIPFLNKKLRNYWDTFKVDFFYSIHKNYEKDISEIDLKINELKAHIEHFKDLVDFAGDNEKKELFSKKLEEANKSIDKLSNERAYKERMIKNIKNNFMKRDIRHE